jgi:hypothetical protein
MRSVFNAKRLQELSNAFAGFKKVLDIDPGNPDYKRLVSDPEEK